MCQCGLLLHGLLPTAPSPAECRRWCLLLAGRVRCFAAPVDWVCCFRSLIRDGVGACVAQLASPRRQPLLTGALLLQPRFAACRLPIGSAVKGPSGRSPRVSG
eukprot:6872879-Alexandrium_andersonii.AAC.1